MPKHETLVNLLNVIIQEWGPYEVHAALSELGHQWDNQAWERVVADRSQRTRKAKPRPVELVERVSIDTERRAALLEIADLYEKKTFLPSTADVREFIFLLGERPKGMKDRSEAFRVLLETLAHLPIDRLRQIQLNAENSGPSQLGPLSDAISGASVSLRRVHPEDDHLQHSSQEAMSPVPRK